MIASGVQSWSVGNPWVYSVLLDLHRASVAASIALFIGRGLGVAAMHSWPMRSGWRYLSVGIDVVLLCAGIGLWIHSGYHPVHHPWLGLKLGMLLIYIVLGSYALKRGRSRGSRLVFFVAALSVVFYMVGIALARHPAGWWA